MTPDSQLPVRRPAWPDWVVIIIFAVLLWLPTVDVFTGIDITRPPSENRLPAPKPKLAQWNLTGLQQYVVGAENYFNDHFGFRKRLIRFCQQWKARLFHDESGHKVLIGQHGWLFAGELQMIEHYLGMNRFTPAQMHSWQTLLEKRRDWLAARGIKYLFVIPPDKHSIYPEELPEWLQTARPPRVETKLDQFLKFMKENSTVEILDLRPALLAAKKTAPVFLQNDTHWNWYGSFIGAQTVISALSKYFPDLPPLKLDDFNWTNQPSTSGDLIMFLGVQRSEKNYFVFTPKPSFGHPRLQVATNIVSQWTSHKPSAISENPTLNTETAVVFGDSFSNPWQVFLSGSFRHIVFMGEHREFNTGVIEQYHPQIVINEMLERFFNTYDPEEIKAVDALP